MADGHWIVHTKGAANQPAFEISVLRENNRHGIASYGWFGSDKLLISHNGGPCHWPVTQQVWNELLGVAERVAASLNAANGVTGTPAPSSGPVKRWRFHVTDFDDNVTWLDAAGGPNGEERAAEFGGTGHEAIDEGDRRSVLWENRTGQLADKITRESYGPASGVNACDGGKRHA